MILVRLDGGLGNQMFQYAFGRSLSIRHDSQLKLDVTPFSLPPPRKGHHVPRNYDLDVFDIEANFATTEEINRFSKYTSSDLLDKLLRKLFGFKKTVLLEPHFHFSSIAYNAPDDRYLIGYWQSPLYFGEIEDKLRSDFTFRCPLSEKASQMLTRINAENSICLNVRRGDFVVNSFHGSYGMEYFGQADEILRGRVTDRHYFVFSDDIEWCVDNIKFASPVTYVTHDYAGPKFADYLRLMSACKHFVIPNSSFAWWAVWFNRNDDKIVIAPKLWFQDSSIDSSDLIPSDWIRI
jgi:hypothetical protein